MKIRTGNYRPSAAMLNTFQRYNKQGLSNELIAMLTGYRRVTVNKYVTDNDNNIKAWDSVKEFAKKQFAVAAKKNQDKETNEIDRQIIILRKAVADLEAKKRAASVAPFDWVVRYEKPKAAAKSKKEAVAKAEPVKSEALTRNAKFNAVTPLLINLFSDKKEHTSSEVDELLKQAGYTTTFNRAATLHTLFGNAISIRRGKYILN